MDKKTTTDFSTDWLISHFRWLWLLTTFLLLVINTNPSSNNTILFFIPAIGVVYNLLVVLLLLVGWYTNWIAATVTLFDAIIGIVLMWLTGGHTSFMPPVLLFPVITSVLRLTPEAGLLLTAVPISLAYGVSIILQNDIQLPTLTKGVTDLATLFGSGIFAGYVSQKRVQAATNRNQTEIKKLRLASERAKAIYEMANTLSSTLNYQNVLNAMVELAQFALAEANGTSQDKSAVGMVLLFEEDDPLGKLRLVSGRNIPRHDERKVISAKEGLLTQVIYKAEAIVGNEVQHDPVLKNFIALQNCQSVVCAPLRAGFDMYGVVLFAHPQKNMYTQEHAVLLTTFCNQAIIPLQNAQLYADLAREQKKLLEREAQARRELARNLHDGPTQAIAAIAMRLNFIQILLKKEGITERAMTELNKIEQIALRTTKEIRAMLFTLRPIVLETQGLSAALKQYADRMKDLHNLNIELDIQKYGEQLSTDKESVVFTIIEEAVGNAKKYANSDVILIRLETLKNMVIAQVIDHGKGFDVEAVKATYDQRGSLGLLNMDERAQMVGGRCHINSAIGKGTTVRVEVPLDGN